MQEGRVIPLLLDLDFKEISGPLAQFQAKKADEAGIKELIVSLNKAAPTPVPDAQLDKLFLALWADLEKQIAAIPKSGVPTKHNRPQGEILEELVSSVRSVEMRVRDMTDDDPMFRRRGRSRMHPAMMHEMMHRIARGPRDPIQILFFASLLRDDAPWIYELAMEVYRSARSGRREERNKATRRFRDALEMIMMGPFAEEMGMDRQMLKMVRSEFFHIFDLMKFDSEDDIATDLEPPKAIQAEKKE